MNVQSIFYGVGATFVIVAVLYFAFTFLGDLPQNIKFWLSVISTLVTFIIAELLRAGGR